MRKPPKSILVSSLTQKQTHTLVNVIIDLKKRALEAIPDIEDGRQRSLMLIDIDKLYRLAENFLVLRSKDSQPSNWQPTSIQFNSAIQSVIRSCLKSGLDEDSRQTILQNCMAMSETAQTTDTVQDTKSIADRMFAAAENETRQTIANRTSSI